MGFNRMIKNINGYNVEISEEITDICGLLFKPQMTQYNNDEDWSVFTLPRSVEVTRDNYNLVEVVSKKYMTHGIMEIGVSRNGLGSFTNAMLTQKPDHIPYLGVDIDDKSFLNDKTKNIYTIRCDSFEQEKVRAYMKEIGMEKISILFIDAWHSVNAVINDWLYTDMLSDDGIVFFHDTNGHPGPTVFLDAIDPKQYVVTKYFEDKPLDFGISTAVRIR
jgi:cephalosporin hydroxylase